jgi:BolA protein
MSRSEEIAERLRRALAAERVEIEDESALHRGHAGARGGAGHYRVLVVSPQFAGQDRVARQRAIYAALADMMPERIHALSSRALTPEEWRALGAK